MKISLFTTVFVSLLASTRVFALPTGFTCVTDANPLKCAIGEAQFAYDVQDLGAGLVQLDILNSGSETATIARIYLDDVDGLLTGQFVGFVPSPPRVNFRVVGAKPRNLPNGKTLTPPFLADQRFSRLAGKGHKVIDGIDTSESLGLQFMANTGDVLHALEDGSLRIGLIAQRFSLGGGESFVNIPASDQRISETPEPGTWLLMVTGVLGLGIYVLRKNYV